MTGSASGHEHQPSPRHPLRITTRLAPDGPPIPVRCRFFEAGYCANGDKCRFQHDAFLLAQQSSKESTSSKAKDLGKEKVSRDGAEDKSCKPAPKLKHDGEKDNVSSSVSNEEEGPEKVSDTSQSEDGLIDFREVYEAFFRDLKEDDDDEERYKRWPGRYDGRSYVSATGKTNGQPRGKVASCGNLWGSRHLQGVGILGYPSFTPSLKVELCRYHVENNCRYGEGCRYEHGIKCEICGKNAIHPKDEEEADRHLKLCLEAKALEDKKAASMDVDCCICMESPVALGRKFGLLTACEHGFCLQCIRKWRGSVGTFGREAVRHCPVCRRESYLVIPSDVYLKDADEKIAAEQQYKSHLSTIPCKHFDFGTGVCPFGESCLYAHADREGNVLETPSRPALLVSGSGEVRPKTVPSLAEYLTKAR